MLSFKRRLDSTLYQENKLLLVIFVFKQKTAYEMRNSDWSSDVCSSDLGRGRPTRMDAETMRTVARLARSRADRGSSATHGDGLERLGEIGRASGRERVCQYV